MANDLPLTESEPNGEVAPVVEDVQPEEIDGQS